MVSDYMVIYDIKNRFMYTIDNLTDKQILQTYQDVMNRYPQNDEVYRNMMDVALYIAQYTYGVR